MKIGLFGARSDTRGLAQQTQGFAKWLDLSRVWGIDLTAEGLSPYNVDWSPYIDSDAELTISTRSAINETDVKHWMEGLDVIIGAETFYTDPFCDWARDMGVRTVLQINPEFQVWHLPDAPRLIKPSRPDVLIAPTTWLLDQMPGVVHLPFPVDRTLFPFSVRKTAEHFVHPGGHRAIQDRAGTRLVFAAARYTPKTRITIRSQSELGLDSRRNRTPELTVEIANLPDSRDLYRDADVVVLPRRYGGQLLTVNEALSCGAPVVMLDREPERNWGGVVTIPSRVRKTMRTHFGALEWSDGAPQALARKIEELQANPERVEALSHAADSYAATIGWEVMKGKYMDLFKSMT